MMLLANFFSTIGVIHMYYYWFSLTICQPIQNVFYTKNFGGGTKWFQEAVFTAHICVSGS